MISFKNKHAILFFFLQVCMYSSLFAQEKKVKKVDLGAQVSMDFIYVPKGSFLMGSPEEEEGRDRDEGPQKNVIIPKGFYMGKFEVTQAQWLAVMHYNPAVFQHSSTHLNHPVESVSWQECQAFISKLNQIGLGKFRLPTEEEWEYVCRAGTQTRFYWGDSKDWQIHQYAWANSRSMGSTQEVGQKPPNPWGFYDMAGNVWEWSSSNYQEEGIQKTNNLKVFRGGSWYDFAKAHRSANRHKHGIKKKYTSIGLRLILEADES